MRLKRLVGVFIASLSLCALSGVPASAQEIECDAPSVLDGRVHHSCGSDPIIVFTIQYTVDCSWPAQDLTFTYTYAGGGNLHYPVDCGWLGNPSPNGVDWEVVDY